MSFEQVPVKREIEIDGFHALYYFEFDKNFYHPPERHDFWELVFAEKESLMIYPGHGEAAKLSDAVYNIYNS